MMLLLYVLFARDKHSIVSVEDVFRCKQQSVLFLDYLFPSFLYISEYFHDWMS
jgi:hypothetical protein